MFCRSLQSQIIKPQAACLLTYIRCKRKTDMPPYRAVPHHPQCCPLLRHAASDGFQHWRATMPRFRRDRLSYGALQGGYDNFRASEAFQKWPVPATVSQGCSSLRQYSSDVHFPHKTLLVRYQTSAIQTS